MLYVVCNYVCVSYAKLIKTGVHRTFCHEKRCIKATYKRQMHLSTIYFLLS